MAIYLVLCQNSVFLSFLKMYIALKPCEWVLEAVIVFVVLDLRAPRLKARPLRYPVGCGLENGKWRKPRNESDFAPNSEDGHVCLGEDIHTKKGGSMTSTYPCRGDSE